MKLARLAFRLFDGLSEKKRTLNCGLQREGGGNAALQMRNNPAYDLYVSLAQGNVAGHGQSYANYPIQERQAGGVVEVYNGYRQRGHLNFGRADGQYTSIQSVNDLGHDRYTLSLKARFGLACQAFVNAWRVT